MSIETNDLITFLLKIIAAGADGQLTAEEVNDLANEARELFDIGTSLDDAVAWFLDLTTRDADQLEARAAKLDAKGKAEKAAKLRAKAADRRASER